MAHNQIHRMTPEDEIELHVTVLADLMQNGVRMIQAQSIQPSTQPFWLAEGFIDYMYDMKAGEPNVIYVPISIAREAGVEVKNG